MRRYSNLAIAAPAELCFGRCVKPLHTRRGMTIGGGIVYPELNFTLPTMFVDETTMPEVREQYRQIITGALQRAVDLEAPGLVAPTYCLEQLIYDCRVMNRALADGWNAAMLYRKWLVDSHALLDPQAYGLTPESAIAIASAIVKAQTPLAAGREAAPTAVRLLQDPQKDSRLKIHPRELSWLDPIQKTVETIPDDEAEFIGEMMGCVDTTRFVAADYDL